MGMGAWTFGSRQGLVLGKSGPSLRVHGSGSQSTWTLKACQSRKICTVAGLLAVTIFAVVSYFGVYYEWAALWKPTKPLKVAAAEGETAPKQWFEDAQRIKLACNAAEDPDVEEVLALTEKYQKEEWYPETESDQSSDREGEWREDEVVKLIKSIVQPRLSRPSPYKYDVCMTIIVRNEYYLKEFLVRNILAGFQKIFLYDDTWGLGDTKIANLIRPFVKAGVVEYRAQDRCKRAKKARDWGTRDSWLQSVTELHGKQCMWIMRLDSDEIVYPMGYPSQRLPEWLSENEDKYCEVRMSWLFPYSGGRSRRRGFALGETLLEAYPTMCFESHLPKHFIQFNNVSGICSSVHWTVLLGYKCLSDLKALKERYIFSDPEPEETSSPRPLLLHYYTKSLEDFLVKKEQSLGPFWRQFSQYYDGGSRTCSLGKRPFPFHKQYIEDVVRVMSVQFTENPDEDSAGEVFERPVMTVEEAGDADDYETYLFVRQQLKEGKWFNQTCYYERFPEVAEYVKNGTFNDATFYFVSTGFNQGQIDCWQTGPESFLYN